MEKSKATVVVMESGPPEPPKPDVAHEEKKERSTSTGSNKPIFSIVMISFFGLAALVLGICLGVVLAKGQGAQQTVQKHERDALPTESRFNTKFAMLDEHVMVDAKPRDEKEVMR